MVAEGYCPERGDLVWINFNSTDGHEEKGMRPAVVVSGSVYNKKTGLCLSCPITSKIKGYPFEVLLDCQAVHGAVLVDQVRSFDWRARKFKFVEKTDKKVIQEVLAKLRVLFD